MKALGVRDLTYRLAFLACSVSSSNPRVGTTKQDNFVEIVHFEICLFLNSEFVSELVFVCTCVIFCVLQFGGRDLREDEMTAETLKKQMTADEWQKVYDMSKDKNLYQNLCSSLFPTIHGVYRVPDIQLQMAA